MKRISHHDENFIDTVYLQLSYLYSYDCGSGTSLITGLV